MFPDELQTSAEYSAFFDPNNPDYRLSLTRGRIPAGAKKMPFQIIATPHDRRPSHTVLVVLVKDGRGTEVEYNFDCTLSAAGFVGRQWGSRPHGAFQAAELRKEITAEDNDCD